MTKTSDGVDLRIAQDLGAVRRARPAHTQMIKGDARDLSAIESQSVDLIVTSPPYWAKRDYEVADQIGHEKTPAEYVASLMSCFDAWRRTLRPTGSIFFNIGDTYLKKSLVGIPHLIEMAAQGRGWYVNNRIAWCKPNGMPEAVHDRLASRSEFVIHFVRDQQFFYDYYGNSPVGDQLIELDDVWNIATERNMSKHVAPFPSELARRAILLGCPHLVCSECGEPRRRVVEEKPLDQQLKEGEELLEKLIKLRDSGVPLNASSPSFAIVKHQLVRATTTGWTGCDHDALQRGVVLDPFVGTGTTVKVAETIDRSAIGIDLTLEHTFDAAEDRLVQSGLF